GFVESWFKQFDWLEYSPPRTNNFGKDTFTKVGNMLLLFWYRKKDPKLPKCPKRFGSSFGDASIKEQMAVVVSSLLILFFLFHFDVGMFLGVQHVPNATSSSLKVALDDMLARYGLSISRFHGLQRLFLMPNVVAHIGEHSRFITMNMNDMRENGWDPLFEELIELSKIYDVDFSDYERTCLMDQLLLFIDETHMF
ncbi:hypothetical protein ACJX0J_030429, partial [Zea mays]